MKKLLIITLLASNLIGFARKKIEIKGDTAHVCPPQTVQHSFNFKKYLKLDWSITGDSLAEITEAHNIDVAGIKAKYSDASHYLTYLKAYNGIFRRGIKIQFADARGNKGAEIKIKRKDGFFTGERKRAKNVGITYYNAGGYMVKSNASVGLLGFRGAKSGTKNMTVRSCGIADTAIWNTDMQLLNNTIIVDNLVNGYFSCDTGSVKSSLKYTCTQCVHEWSVTPMANSSPSSQPNGVVFYTNPSKDTTFTVTVLTTNSATGKKYRTTTTYNVSTYSSNTNVFSSPSIVADSLIVNCRNKDLPIVVSLVAPLQGSTFKKLTVASNAWKVNGVYNPSKQYMLSGNSFTLTANKTGTNSLSGFVFLEYTNVCGETMGSKSIYIKDKSNYQSLTIQAPSISCGDSINLGVTIVSTSNPSSNRIVWSQKPSNNPVGLVQFVKSADTTVQSNGYYETRLQSIPYYEGTVSVRVSDTAGCVASDNFNIQIKGHNNGWMAKEINVAGQNYQVEGKVVKSTSGSGLVYFRDNSSKILKYVIQNTNGTWSLGNTGINDMHPNWGEFKVINDYRTGYDIVFYTNSSNQVAYRNLNRGISVSPNSIKITELDYMPYKLEIHENSDFYLLYQNANSDLMMSRIFINTLTSQYTMFDANLLIDTAQIGQVSSNLATDYTMISYQTILYRKSDGSLKYRFLSNFNKVFTAPIKLWNNSNGSVQYFNYFRNSNILYLNTDVKMYKMTFNADSTATVNEVHSTLATNQISYTAVPTDQYDLQSDRLFMKNAQGNLQVWYPVVGGADTSFTAYDLYTQQSVVAGSLQYNAQQPTFVSTNGKIMYLELLTDGNQILCLPDNSLRKETETLENVNSNTLFYPNPSTGLLNISATDVQKLELYNLSGTLLDTFEANQSIIDISGYQTGSYVLLVTKTDFSKVKAIVVKE